MPSESTIRVYTANLNSLAKDMGHPMMPEGYEWLRNHKAVFETIKLSPSMNTWNNKLFAIKWLLDVVDAPKSILPNYEIYIAETKEAIEDARTNKKSTKEDENWLTKKQLMGVLTDLESQIKRSIKTLNEYRNVMKYLCLKIHIETPLRNDLANSKIFLDPTDEDLSNKDYNYIVLDSQNKRATFIDNVYKTKKHHGTLIIHWSEEISKELFSFYHQIVAFTTDNYFLINQNGDQMTPNNYTKFLKGIFSSYDKNISSSMIRHIIVSELYELDEEKEAAKKDLAYKMGHTTGIAGAIYAKL